MAGTTIFCRSEWQGLHRVKAILNADGLTKHSFEDKVCTQNNEGRLVTTKKFWGFGKMKYKVTIIFFIQLFYIFLISKNNLEMTFLATANINLYSVK